MGFSAIVLGLVGTALLISSLALPWFSTDADLGHACNATPLHILSGVLQGDESTREIVTQLEEYLQKFPIYQTHLQTYFDRWTLNPIMKFVAKLERRELLVAGVLLMHSAALASIVSSIGGFLALFGTAMIGFVMFTNKVQPCVTLPFSGPVFAAAGVAILFLSARLAVGSSAPIRRPRPSQEKGSTTGKAKKDN